MCSLHALLVVVVGMQCTPGNVATSESLIGAPRESGKTFETTVDLIGRLRKDLRKDNDDYGSGATDRPLNGRRMQVYRLLDPMELARDMNLDPQLDVGRNESISTAERASVALTIPVLSSSPLPPSTPSPSSAPTSGSSTPLPLASQSIILRSNNNRFRMRPGSLNRLDKFKKFLVKNKSPFADFVRGKRLRTTPVARTASEKRMLRDSGEPWQEQHLELPSVNQLDMAPAKGGRIHAVKLKNRLCHRHVLLPEGPKYDSRGNINRPAFFPQRHGHDYSRTNPPKMLLPRCCNCCRKSVLGCE